jgi:pilus assembly protein TadC
MQRALALAIGTLTLFAVVALVMIRFMPAPLKDSDYLVVGSVSTLAALLVLFVLLISTSMKSRDVFFKRRKKKS